MNLWFIKCSNNKEFQERIKNKTNISLVAEEMCHEGKGISFLNKNIESNIKEKELLVKCVCSDKYFKLSINFSIEGNAESYEI